MAFVDDYIVMADGNTDLVVKYTNRADRVEYCIGRFEYWLQNDSPKIVGLDVEYTWPSGSTQKAAVIQLCVGVHVLLYHVSVADEHCQKLKDFLLDKDYTFVGVDIENDKKKLRRVGLEIGNFVDIQTIWRVPDQQKIKDKDSLVDYAGSIIHHRYKTMKNSFMEEDHHVWATAPLSLKHIYYASMDGYATYEVYRRLINFQKGLQTLSNPVKPTKRSQRSGRKN